MQPRNAELLVVFEFSGQAVSSTDDTPLQTHPMNLADELTRQAQVRPAATAIQTPTKSLGFHQLETLVWQAARHLQQEGVTAGDIVALSFADEPTLLVALLATARIGATAFSVPHRQPALHRSEIAGQGHASCVAGDRDNARIAGLPFLAFTLDALAATDGAVPADVRISSPQAPFLIMHGSGSTGIPRLLAVSHAQFLARTRIGGAMLSLSPADRLASLSSLDFTSPKERSLAALFSGASLALFDRQRLDPIADCRQLGVTVLDATVFHLEQILATLPRGARGRLDFLRLLQVSASTVSDGLRQRVVKALTTALQVRYGTNEAGPISFATPDEVLKTSGTVGRPPPDVRIEIVDGREEPLPAGSTGLIRVASPGLIDGYAGNEPASRGVFRSGWFYPGDLGRFAPNGQLIFCGRADQLMIMNGINIYPAEIEHVVSLHSAVRDAAVLPLRSAIHQDVPVCAVVLHAGARITERELLAFASQRLGSHGPRRVVILDRIPRSEQGKLIRAELAREIAGKPDPGIAGKLSPLPAMSCTTCQTRPRQPLRQIHLPIHRAAAVDLSAVDNWLTAVLEIAVEPCNCPNPPPWEPGSEHALAAELAWRILLLNRALLQIAHIPVFDAGCVLRIERDGRDQAAWVATVALPLIEQMPLRPYALASGEAARLVRWLAEKPRTPENAAALFDVIQKQALPALKRGGVMSGKSTLPVLRAAHALNIPFGHLGAGIYQLGWGNRSVLVDRSTTAMDSAIGSKLAQNKVWSASLLRTAGLPAPQHGVATSGEEAMRLAHRLGWPVVVKPLDRERGEGVTVGISDDNRLQAAFKLARNLSRARRAIVEREAAGVCHRLFIADGRLLYAVKRWPKSIHGDGRRTVAELVEAANRIEDRRPPWLRSERYPDDTEARVAVATAGFTFNSIPAVGERVPLRNIESTAWGGFDEDVTNRIHPDNLDIALRTAALFGLQVAGIDIITPDIGRPWHENGAIINEVNFAPLLGGGEISRSHIPEFLARLIDGDGRIPIEAFVGGDAALAAATARQQEFAGEQINCVVTSHSTTLASSGTEMHFPFDSLYRRCKALLLDRRVGAIVLVVQTDELLRSGLPADRIDSVMTTGDALKQSRSPKAQENLLALLRSHANPS